MMWPQKNVHHRRKKNPADETELPMHTKLDHEKIQCTQFSIVCLSYMLWRCSCTWRFHLFCWWPTRPSTLARTCIRWDIPGAPPTEEVSSYSLVCSWYDGCDLRLLSSGSRHRRKLMYTTSKEMTQITSITTTWEKKARCSAAQMTTHSSHILLNQSMRNHDMSFCNNDSERYYKKYLITLIQNFFPAKINRKKAATHCSHKAQSIFSKIPTI